MVDMETKRMSSSDHNRVVGNVFYGFESRSPKIPDGMDNESDYNLFVNPVGGTPFDLAAWQKKTGLDRHGQVAAATLEFSAQNWKLRGMPPTPECPRLVPITCDYFNVPRSGTTTDAGPFLKPNLKPEMVLIKKDSGSETRP